MLLVEASGCGEQRQASLTVVSTPEGPVAVTNAHVVRGSGTVTVHLGARTEELAVRGAVVGRDLAILEAPAALDAAALPVGPTGAVGASVLVAGFPDGAARADTATVRTIEARTARGATSEVLVADAQVRGGSSGGALVDAEGRVVGIVAARDPSTGHAVAHPASDALAGGARGRAQLLIGTSQGSGPVGAAPYRSIWRRPGRRLDRSVARWPDRRGQGCRLAMCWSISSTVLSPDGRTERGQEPERRDVPDVGQAFAAAAASSAASIAPSSRAEHPARSAGGTISSMSSRAIALNASAAGPSPRATGWPWSPPSATAASMGIFPSSGMPASAARSSPPPRPNRWCSRPVSST